MKRKRESESGWNDIERLDDDVAGQEDAGLPIWKVNTLVAAGGRRLRARGVRRYSEDKTSNHAIKEKRDNPESPPSQD